MHVQRVAASPSFQDLVDCLGRGGTDDWRALYRQACGDPSLRLDIREALRIVDPDLGAARELWQFLLEQMERDIDPQVHATGRLRHTRVRILRKLEDKDQRDSADLAPADRLSMMWQLARDAWAFKGDTEHAQSRLQRHVVRAHRRRG
jgi:hypothetical protein